MCIVVLCRFKYVYKNIIGLNYIREDFIRMGKDKLYYV